MSAPETRGRPGGEGPARPGDASRGPGRPFLGRLFGIDVRSLALFRVGLALVLLADLLTRARFVVENYSDLGLVPRAILPNQPHTRFPSLHALSGAPAFEAALFAVAAGLAVMLLLGWRTRLATVGCWYLLLSLQVRNPLFLNAGDRILGLLLFWSLFLPLGAVGSLDARRSRWRGPSTVLSPASAALLVQFACIYFFAGVSKSGPEWTREGSAISYALANAYWSRPLGQWLLGFPELMRGLTFSTLALELLGPPLLFLPVLTVPARCLLIPAFLVFQHSIRLTIELGVFPWICSVALLPFVPGAVWERAGGWARGLVAGVRDSAPRQPPGRLARLGWAAFLALWGLVLVSNLALVHRSLSLPGPLRELIAYPRLMQAWGMYGPAPPKYSYGYAWEGVRRDGRSLDLFEAGEGPAWERAARLHGDYRFKMYVDDLVRRGEPFQSRYVGWLCPRWNAGAAEGGRIESVRLHMRHQPLLPGGQPGGEGVHARVVFDLPCDAWAPFE